MLQYIHAANNLVSAMLKSTVFLIMYLHQSYQISGTIINGISDIDNIMWNIIVQYNDYY